MKQKQNKRIYKTFTTICRMRKSFSDSPYICVEIRFSLKNETIDCLCFTSIVEAAYQAVGENLDLKRSGQLLITVPLLRLAGEICYCANFRSLISHLN